MAADPARPALPVDLVLTFLAGGRLRAEVAGIGVAEGEVDRRLLVGIRIDRLRSSGLGPQIFRAVFRGSLLELFTRWEDAVGALGRIVLLFEDLEFETVPWESLRHDTDPQPRFQVLRRVFRPRPATAPFRLPFRIMQLDSGSPAAVDLPELLAELHDPPILHVERHPTDSTGALLEQLLLSRSCDVLHLEEAEVDETLRLWSRDRRDGPLDTWDLARILDPVGTRLLVLNASREPSHEGYLRFAREIAERGGPPVLVSHFDDARDARAFYARFYREILHDQPLDTARREADRSVLVRSGLFGATSLTAGSGSEDLLHLSSLAPRVYRRRAEAHARLRQIYRVTDEARDLREEPLEPDARRRGELEALLPLASPPRSYGVGDHSTGAANFLALARNLQLTDEVLAAIEKAESELEEQSLQREKAGEAPEPPERHVNTWLEDYRQGWAKAPQSVPLRAGTLYRLHVDIGPRADESSVVNPHALSPAALEPIFRKGGDWLQIAIYSQHFELSPWNVEGEDPTQNSTAAGSAMRPLWLPAVASSQPIVFEVTPKEAGEAYLRLCVYYRNQLLQSLRLDAQVVAAAGEAPLPGSRDGYATRIEYTVSADFRDLALLPSRAVALFTNKIGDTHMVGVKCGEWDEAGAQPDDWTFAVSLPPGPLEERARAVRAALDEIGTAKVDKTELYAFASAPQPGQPVNGAEPAKLQAALQVLAKHGYPLYNDLFPSPEAQRKLAAALGPPGRTIHIARLLADGDVLPWSILYDLELDTELDLDVCLEPLQHADAEGRLVHRPCGGGVCPLHQSGENRNSVVCPWGFWGIKHILEQPPQRIDDETIHPRSLIQEIAVPAKPRVSMSLSTQLDDFDKHRKELADLPQIAFTDAGDDRPQPGKPQPKPGREQVLEELHHGDLHFIYFYCHGGKTAQLGYDRPCLSVGSTQTPYLLPDSFPFAKYHWSEHPLVFLNACRSVDLEPKLLGGFVQTFVERGAGGVIGTEVRVWEPLAAAFAVRFLQKFLNRERVGYILRDLRHEFLRLHNPLGLVYTNYCSADLHLALAGNEGETAEP